MKPSQAFTILAEAIKEHGEPMCMQTDPDLFFPETGGRNGDVQMAMRLCNRCPVREECLQFAIVNNEMFDIWGGLSVTERNKIANRRKGRPRTT